MRLVSIVLFTLLAAAAAPVKSPVDPVNKTRQGIALKGYDPVAYFEEGQPVKGASSFVYEWMGAHWQFKSKENRDRFQQDPDRYAPQFGGYCSWAVAHNYTADIDPEAWKIVDGKLYLNYSKDVQRKWQEDMSKYIQEAKRNWSGLRK